MRGCRSVRCGIVRFALLTGLRAGVALPVAAADPAPSAPPRSVAGAPPGTAFIRRLDAGGATAAPVGLPVRLKIPAINVDAAVEQVGLTPDGAMDAPKDYANTAWYMLGPRPGEVGNAAIDGHVDSTTGTAVFWDLPKLTPGDVIIVVGSDGVERRFRVTAVETYLRDAVPLARVFGPTTAVRLNLITCDARSAFDRARGTYAGNVVVYTEAADPT